LLSACAHVAWNLQVKRSPVPAIHLWLLIGVGTLLGLPVALIAAAPYRVPAAGWLCILGTGGFYAGYYTLTARSYDRDDLSRAYPIARGVAPAAAALWGVLLYREHPTLMGGVGILSVCAGVLLVALATGAGAGLSTRTPGASGVLLAGLNGLCISGYSTVDKIGVQLVHPALYIVLTFGAGWLFQGAILARGWGRAAIDAEWRRAGRQLWAGGALAIGAYLLILLVLRGEPVSYVVPLRSISVLLSVLAGTRLLGEEGVIRRLAGAGLILLGVTCIALRG
jgi:drug/metabolite transporter (DMT)-like permease